MSASSRCSAVSSSGADDQQVLGFGRRSDESLDLVLLAAAASATGFADGGHRHRCGSGQGRRRAWRGNKRRAPPVRCDCAGAVQNTQGRAATRSMPVPWRNGTRRSSMGNHSVTVANAPMRPMMANTAICLRPGNGADRQRRIADQGGGEPQRDAGHHIGKPLSSGDRRRAERRGAIVQAVVDRDADQARAEQQRGDMDLTEHEEGAGEGHGDADAQRQQVEQQRRQAAKDADDQQNGAGRLEDRQHRHFIDRRTRALLGEEDGAGAEDFHVRHRLGDLLDRAIDGGDQPVLHIEVEGIVPQRHRHDDPGHRRVDGGQHAVVQREASQRARQGGEERRQQQERIGGEQCSRRPDWRSRKPVPGRGWRRRRRDRHRGPRDRPR